MTHDPRLDLSAYPIAHEIALRYGDVDRQGHLNNVAIATLYQEARLEVLERAFGPITTRSRILVAEQTLRFLCEGFPIPTTFGSGVSRIGRSSYHLAHGMFQGGRCIGLCDTVLVNVGDDGRSEPLPDQVRTVLEGLMLRLDEVG